MGKAEAKGKGKGSTKGGLDEALGVGVAAVALVAGAGVAASRRVRTIKNGQPPSDTAPVVPIRPADPPAPPTGIKGKLVTLGERFEPLGWALKIQERYGDLHGNNLAAAITFQAFVSLFPLLLVAVAIIGFVAGGGTDIAGRVIREPRAQR